jgi:hypothetical protein
MERQYDLTGYFDLVEWFPFNDHNAPPLEMIKLFCDSVDKYLAEDPQNVVAVHCKAGKGRTGCVCAAYLQHSGVTETAQEALDFFGRERTHNCKGVTIPSQKRYYYYGAMLQSKLLHVPAKTYHVQHIRFVTVPLSSHGVDPWFEVFFWQKVGDCEWEEKKIYNYCNFAKVLQLLLVQLLRLREVRVQPLAVPHFPTRMHYCDFAKVRGQTRATQPRATQP